MVQLSLSSNIYWKSPRDFCQETLLELKKQKVLLIINNSSVMRFSLDKWINELKSCCNLLWLNEISSNPTPADILRVLQLCSKETPYVIIAIGGGSVIDMAKICVALFYLRNNEKLTGLDIVKSIEDKEYLQHQASVPIYAVPTTAGTGSEVTRWATVWDIKKQVKYSVEAPWLQPHRAYIIPEFTCFMPKRLTLSTGLDALCQAVEAYWAKASNPLVKEISKIAIRLLIEYVPKVLSDVSNVYYRKKVCLGALFSGIAFSHTRTTACHSISYPLTMCFGIEHGLACALSLAKVMQINLPYIDEADELLKVLNIKNPKELQLWLDDLACGIVKLRLSFFGIKEDSIDKLVSLSFTQGRMDNNPVDLTPKDVKEILNSLME